MCILVCRLKKYQLDGPNVHALGAVKTVPPRPVCEKLQHHLHHPINLVKLSSDCTSEMEFLIVKTTLGLKNGIVILFSTKPEVIFTMVQSSNFL